MRASIRRSPALVEQAVERLRGDGRRGRGGDARLGDARARLVRFFWPATFAGASDHLPEFESADGPGLRGDDRSTPPSFTVPQYHADAAERRFAYVQRDPRLHGGLRFPADAGGSVAAFPADRLQPAHWPQHEWDWLIWAEFSYPFNWSGSPAASLPCGFTPAGLPVGLQIVGRRFDDVGVLQASAAFEAARPWAQHVPPAAL